MHSPPPPQPLHLPTLVATNNRTLPETVLFMSQSTPRRSSMVPAAMPTPRSDLAPYFSGRVDDPIEDFLDEYEDLADSCGLSERQKAEAVIRYIPYVLKDFWKSLDGYRAHNWTDLRHTLEEIYEGPSTPSRQYRVSERWRPLPPTSYKSRDSHHQHPDTQRAPPPEVETKVVHFREPAPSREEEDTEIDDLMECMNSLSPLDTHTPTPSATSFAFQAPVTPPPPTGQPWPAAANPPVPHIAADYTFCPRVRIDNCSFCLQTGHRIRECCTAQEYVRSGRALVLGDRLHLPNGHPIPNDGTGRGLKRGLDAWLAMQPKDAQTPAQQVSGTCEAPPTLPHIIGDRAPFARRVKETTEVCIVQVTKAEQTEEEDPFLQVFAAEKKKHEIRRSRPPMPRGPRPSASLTAGSATASASVPALVAPTVAVPFSASSAAAPVAPVSPPAAPALLPATAPTFAAPAAAAPVIPATPTVSATHASAASPAIRKERIDKPQTGASSFEGVANVQVLTLSCQRQPPPQPPVLKDPDKGSMPVLTPKRFQALIEKEGDARFDDILVCKLEITEHEHEICRHEETVDRCGRDAPHRKAQIVHCRRAHHSCVIASQSTSSVAAAHLPAITTSFSSMPAIAVARPPVLKDPDKSSLIHSFVFAVVPLSAAACSSNVALNAFSSAPTTPTSSASARPTPDAPAMPTAVHTMPTPAMPARARNLFPPRHTRLTVRLQRLHACDRRLRRCQAHYTPQRDSVEAPCERPRSEEDPQVKTEESDILDAQTANILLDRGRSRF